MASRSFGSQGPDRPHLSTGEIADLRGDVETAFVAADAYVDAVKARTLVLENRVGINPMITRLTGLTGGISAGTPAAIPVVGTGFLQSQAFATLALGAGTAALTFTALRPGTPGNAITVTIVQGGAGASVGLVGTDITITLAAANSTANAVKILLDNSVTINKLIATASGGAGTVLIASKTPLASGTGTGLKLLLNGIELPVTAKVTDTAIAGLGLVDAAIISGDVGVLRVVSNDLISESVTVTLIA